MSYKLTIFCTVMLFYLTTNSCIAGGPWAHGKGNGFAQFGLSSTNYKNIFDPNGKTLHTLDKFQELTFQLYSEIGVTKKITLKIISPYKLLNGESSTMTDSKQNFNDIGNIVFGASYLFRDKKIKFAARLDLSSPGNKDDNNPSFYNLKTGYTEWEVSPFISIGSSSEKYYWYSDIGAGITKNSVFKLNAEAGYSVSNSIKSAAVIDVRIPFQTKNTVAEQPEGLISPSFLYDPFQQYIGTGVKLIYTYKEKYGISASAFGAFLAKRVGSNWALNLGLFYKW